MLYRRRKGVSAHVRHGASVRTRAKVGALAVVVVRHGGRVGESLERGRCSREGKKGGCWQLSMRAVPVEELLSVDGGSEDAERRGKRGNFCGRSWRERSGYRDRWLESSVLCYQWDGGPTSRGRGGPISSGMKEIYWLLGSLGITLSRGPVRDGTINPKVDKQRRKKGKEKGSEEETSTRAW